MIQIIVKYTRLRRQPEDLVLQHAIFWLLLN